MEITRDQAMQVIASQNAEDMSRCLFALTRAILEKTGGKYLRLEMPSEDGFILLAGAKGAYPPMKQAFNELEKRPTWKMMMRH